jgi:hypothetical protein
MPKQLISLQELIATSTSSHIPYNKLLGTFEWKNKRNEIIERDKGYCTNCGKGETITHDEYDHPSGRFYFWYGKEVTVAFSDDSCDEIPEIIISSKPYWMEVHHKHYIFNRLPWDYNDDVFITLCNWCHGELHKTQDVYTYSDELLTRTINLEPCQRCNGVGWIEEYGHVENGICFNCRGTKYEPQIITITSPF